MRFATLTSIACIFWIRCNEGCKLPALEDWPFEGAVSADMGDIECGQTVEDYTSPIGQDGIFDNFWHVYRLLIQGENCEVDVESCPDDSANFRLPLIQIFDSDREIIPVNRTRCGAGNRYYQLPNVSLSTTDCTAYYVGIGGEEHCDAGNYTLTVNCAQCTSCVLEEEEEEDPSIESSESNESGDDAKADLANRELPDDDHEIFGYTEEDKDIPDNDKKVVTLRVADMVWENIYGAIIVLMVCCAMFCCIFTKADKQSV